MPKPVPFDKSNFFSQENNKLIKEFNYNLERKIDKMIDGEDFSQNS